METQGKSRFDFIFKIVLVGDSTTGKTSLISRYVDDTFSTSTLTTIGIDFKLKTVEVEGYRVKLQLWDTAGQERYAPMGEMYYRGSHACLVVYDITRKSTFNNMPRWLNKISELKSDDKSLIVLVGCKADLSDIREVSSDTGQKLAIEEGARWVEVSSKNGEGVEQLFSDIARHLVLKKTDYLHQSSDMSREPVSSFDVVPRLPSVTEQRGGRKSVLDRLSRLSLSNRRSRTKSVIKGDQLADIKQANTQKNTQTWSCIL